MTRISIPKPANIDEYIGGFPNDVQEILERVRMTIQKAAPDAKEKISYSMPAFEQNGIVVYFAAYKNHIGLYALPDGHAAFKNELSKYKSGKGSVQFPLNQPVPLDLIAKIVKYRVHENLEKVKNK
ncbi:iron chaperone [Flavobacterium sp. W22_SRS_FK3]|uniref:iron chaperone n=1 Tax=Flavobacterium sp. W22_SRS_FK3 TaxID=3240275 RepID=UPI003F8EEF7A